MYFIFVMTAALGGYMTSRGFLDGGIGKAFLGLMIAIISVIACGVIGFPA